MDTAFDRMMRMALKAESRYVRGTVSDYHVATVSSGMNDQEEYARLFAAAPKLLEALSTLIDVTDGLCDRAAMNDSDKARLEAALAKARAAMSGTV